MNSIGSLDDLVTNCTRRHGSGWAEERDDVSVDLGWPRSLDYKKSTNSKPSVVVPVINAQVVNVAGYELAVS